MKKEFFILLIFLSTYALQSQVQFENQATALGINVATGFTFLGNGVSFCDFDNDGWDDITLTSEDGDEVRFFKNVNGSFVEQNYNLQYLNYETRSVTWVDFDNDGDNDLFVTSETVGNKLLENLGNMTFQDITSTSGISINNLYTYGASWGDYNNDGFLDVFLSNRTFLVPNKLYKNDGDGTFTDVSFQAGIDLNPVLSFCSAFLDINNDGFQDIYVSNDKVNLKSKLYKNNGDGTFDDISMSSGTDMSIDAMTVTVGDYNSDGYFDIYVTNNSAGNYLLKNNGDETFTNVSGPTGTILNSFSWGAVFFDADNNKALDLYVSTAAQSTTSAGFYLNNGSDSFTLSNSSFPNNNRASHSNAAGDINNDGLIDLVVTNNYDDDIFLWKNTSVLSNSNWIKLKFIGTTSNREGVGTRIEISVNGEKQYLYTHCGEGYLSQNSKLKHIGLGDSTIIDYIKLTWLSGVEDIIYNVPVNQVLTVTEGSNTLGLTNVSQVESYIYPNPVGDILKINSDTTINKVRVTNLLGQEVLVVNLIENNSVDVSSLQAGHYILVLESDKGIWNHKLIKE
ncbi:Por secretion system C-terminal sorting domain-containing protein [Formosa sp. Hel1_31_208]|uniref:FG-GAP-like repeat-containing protein n=1 Tax=Formosa sp. Hel1_31_208 TaxID=1798225 RepID=UPI00087A486B|nr:FG-GAP-like repeat-containing protein [Formosa sp. Hel1_31_208]SDS53607.1 Por secretion system C-terminal sorting domain-containing protein [Formosa sp. Hel1_31_208]